MIRRIPLPFIALAPCLLAGGAANVGEGPLPERAPIQLSRELQNVRLLLMDGAAAEAEQVLLGFDSADLVASTLDAWVGMQRQEMMDPSLAYAMLQLRAEGLRDIRSIDDIRGQLEAVVSADPGLKPLVADVIYEAAAMELYDVLDEGRGVVLGDFTLYSSVALSSDFNPLPVYGVFAVRHEAFPPDELLEAAAAGPGFFAYANGFALVEWGRQQDAAVVSRWKPVYDDIVLQFASAGRFGSAIQTAVCSGVAPNKMLDWLLELLKFAEQRGPNQVRALQVAVATLLEASPEFTANRKATAPGKLAELLHGFRQSTPSAEFQAAAQCAGLDNFQDLWRSRDAKASGQ